MGHTALGSELLLTCTLQPLFQAELLPPYHTCDGVLGEASDMCHTADRACSSIKAIPSCASPWTCWAQSVQHPVLPSHQAHSHCPLQSLHLLSSPSGGQHWPQEPALNSCTAAGNVLPSVCCQHRHICGDGTGAGVPSLLGTTPKLQRQSSASLMVTIHQRSPGWTCLPCTRCWEAPDSTRLH